MGSENGEKRREGKEETGPSGGWGRTTKSQERTKREGTKSQKNTRPEWQAYTEMRN